MDCLRRFFGRKQSVAGESSSSSSGSDGISCFGFSLGNRNKKDHDSDEEKSITDESTEPLIAGENSSAKIFEYGELVYGTKNFNPRKLLGRGGFGDVFKGRLRIDRKKQTVAIKKHVPRGGQGAAEYVVELVTLNRAHHPNLIKLVGFCSEGDHKILVYEYMPFKSLDLHLHDHSPSRPPLDWITRLKIALGTIRGLEYLHHTLDPPAFYRDLKSSNILLDEKYHAKLSDFGLAKTAPTDGRSSVVTRVLGTYGYIAPEYALTNILSTSSDIYSFGVLLLEIIAGRKPYDEHDPNAVELLVWADPLLKDRSKYSSIADVMIQSQFEEMHLERAIELVKRCLVAQSNERPTATEIATILEDLVGDVLRTQNRGEDVKRKGIALTPPIRWIKPFVPIKGIVINEHPSSS